MRKYEAISWDLDGTLLDSGPMWNTVINETLTIHEIICTPEEKDLLASIPLIKILHKKGISEEKIIAIYHTIRLLVMQYVEKNGIKWMEGAEGTLAGAKVPQAIVTSSDNAFFDLIDSKLNIRRRVSTVITVDDVHGYPKPHSTGLLLAATSLQVNRKDLIHTGDQQCDLDAARNAGMDALLFRGPHTPSHVRHTRVATTFGGVQLCLRELFQSSR